MDVAKQDRDIKNLSPDFRFKVACFMADHRIKELWVAISEWLRSKERQEYLYAQWRTRPWPKITWTLKSNHITWNAIDIFCTDKKLGLYPANMDWWNEVFDIWEFFWIKSLYRQFHIEKAHLENNKSAEPDQSYINNQHHMETIEQKTMKAVESMNSALWHATTNADLKKRLESMNNYLRLQMENST